MRARLLMSSFLLLAAVGSAQRDTRRANMTGARGGDQGKCTIEVEVDGVAEVEVSGDTGRIRTLSGAPAVWRRMDCSDAIPRNPSDFRFRGIDGRGRVALIRDPRNNRGVAVVRIEDSKGGREGYTFDLEWSGGNYSSQPYGRGGQGQGYGYGRDRDRDRRGGDGYRLTCESDRNRRRFCEADTDRGVRIVRELSNRSCVMNQTWGYDRRGIWVDRGCRAEFEVGR